MAETDTGAVLGNESKPTQLRKLIHCKNVLREISIDGRFLPELADEQPCRSPLVYQCTVGECVPFSK